MRVLLLHNRYRALGGEERVLGAQAELLARHGHQVEVLERDSSTLSRRQAARGLLGGGLSPELVADTLARFQADVLHAHNLHPAFGWRALASARAAGVRTVLQLHNFRLYCAIGVAYRDGAPCHACQRTNTLPGLVHRCRGGVSEAGVYAAGLAAQQRRLLANTDALIGLSFEHLNLLARHGLDSTRARVVPNFIADSDWAESSRADQGEYALVAGRLVEEKGFDTAIAAAAAAGVPLVVAGVGPDEARLRALAGEAEVSFTGWLEPDRLAQLQAGAGVVLVPSRCEEAFGYGALDAFANGVPVISSDRGGLGELVGPCGGTVLSADDRSAWRDALARLFADPERRRELGQTALERARERYGERAALAELLAVYRG